MNIETINARLELHRNEAMKLQQHYHAILKRSQNELQTCQNAFNQRCGAITELEELKKLCGQNGGGDDKNHNGSRLRGAVRRVGNLRTGVGVKK